MPLAAAGNVIDWPTAAVWLTGFVSTTGDALTCTATIDSVAAEVVAVPTELVKTARYRVPEFAVVAVTL